MMTELHLHSSGRRDYLKNLQKKHELNVAEIKNDSKLSDSQKAEQLKKLKDNYRKQVAMARFSLFAER